MWLNCICCGNVKCDRFVAMRRVFQALNSKYSKTRFRPGLCPGPRWGAYDPLPILSPLDDFGVSISASSAPRLSAPHNKNSWLRLWVKIRKTSRRDVYEWKYKAEFNHRYWCQSNYDILFWSAVTLQFFSNYNLRSIPRANWEVLERCEIFWIDLRPLASIQLSLASISL